MAKKQINETGIFAPPEYMENATKRVQIWAMAKNMEDAYFVDSISPDTSVADVLEIIRAEGIIAKSVRFNGYWLVKLQ